MTTTVRWLSGITMVLVLIQAALIGQGLYLGEPSRTALHGWLGNVTFVAVIILAGLVVMGVRRGDLNRLALGLGALITLLTVAQIGLGYAGRSNGMPIALHIPNGVLIAMLLVALLMISFLPAASMDRTRS